MRESKSARAQNILFMVLMHKVHVSKNETRRDNVNIESVAQLNGA